LQVQIRQAFARFSDPDFGENTTKATALAGHTAYFELGAMSCHDMFNDGET
jgi:hypothetical protein